MNVDLNQGEEYEEQDVTDEVDEDDDVETVVDTIYGIPKQYVYLGAAVVVVLIIGIVVFATRKSIFGDKKKQENVVTDTWEDNTYSPDLDMSISTDTGSFGDVLVDDPYAGMDFPEDLYYEDVYYDMEDISSEDMIRLRGYGYTGDEIEYALSHGFSVDALIERAKSRLDSINAESWRRTSDASSEEYKYLMDKTYLGQPEAMPVIDQREMDPLQVINDYTNVVINCDYEKCPMNGLQLYLKCKIANDTYYWYPVRPARWATLPQSGNIVLRITFNNWAGSTYIVDAEETDSTLDTIDSSNDIHKVTEGVTATEAVPSEEEYTGEESEVEEGTDETGGEASFLTE